MGHFLKTHSEESKRIIIEIPMKRWVDEEWDIRVTNKATNDRIITIYQDGKVILVIDCKTGEFRISDEVV
jgi:hypothetical protein